MNENIDSLKDEEKEKLDLGFDGGDEVSQSETNERHAHRNKSNNNWLGGIMLIAIGVIFLFANISDFELNNWWALFILIPAFGSLGKAFTSYRDNGRFSSESRGALIGGLILTLVASIFLFGWDWGQVWPLFLIIGGVGALLSGWFD